MDQANALLYMCSGSVWTFELMCQFDVRKVCIYLFLSVCPFLFAMVSQVACHPCGQRRQIKMGFKGYGLTCHLEQHMEYAQFQIFLESLSILFRLYLFIHCDDVKEKKMLLIKLIISSGFQGHEKEVMFWLAATYLPLLSY